MKRITYFTITLAMCLVTSCSTKSDYEIEKEEFAAEKAGLAKEQQELTEEEAELRKEYEELRQEYLREKKKFQQTVVKKEKPRTRTHRQLTDHEIDTLSQKIRSSGIWPVGHTLNNAS